MPDTADISIGAPGDRRGETGRPDGTISLPLDTVLTGRGFVAGDDGSGVGNTAAVLAERLLERDAGLFVVDSDGSHTGLQTAYELLRVGGDETCDLQVTSEHADQLATVALDRETPVLLDVSTYLDETAAEAVLAAVAQRLYARANESDTPLLLLVDDLETYLPERGTVGECGRILRTISSEGPLRGLGICGLTRRPGAVQREFISDCDWQLYHRTDWNNDAAVIRRRLGSEYVSQVADLEEDEAFLRTVDTDSIRRVSLDSRRTPVTVGHRSAVQRVSPAIVATVAMAGEETTDRDDRIGALRADLAELDGRLAELEATAEPVAVDDVVDEAIDRLLDIVGVEDVGDLNLVDRGPTRTEGDAAASDGAQAGAGGDTNDTDGQYSTVEDFALPGADLSSDAGDEQASIATGDQSASGAGGRSPAVGDEQSTARASSGEASGETGKTGFDPMDLGGGFGADDTVETDRSESADSGTGFSADDILGRLADAPGKYYDDVEEDHPDSWSTPDFPDGPDRDSEATFVGGIYGEETERVVGEDTDPGVVLPDQEPAPVSELKAEIEDLDQKPRSMLAYYRKNGPETPMNAHFAAGGEDDRTRAYAYNRDLRQRGLIEHVGEGNYDYSLCGTVRELLGDHVDQQIIDALVEDIESATDLAAGIETAPSAGFDGASS